MLNDTSVDVTVGEERCAFAARNGRMTVLEMISCLSGSQRRGTASRASGRHRLRAPSTNNIVGERMRLLDIQCHLDLLRIHGEGDATVVLL